MERLRRGIVAWLILAMVFGVILGMLVAEYKVGRFGEMVCQHQHGLHYRFAGFVDGLGHRSYTCIGDERDAYNGTVIG